MTVFSINAHHGYLVVRLPQYNFDPQGRGAFRSEPPKLGTIYYGGVFRMPWFDLEEDHYFTKLPPELSRIRRQIKAQNQDFSGIEVCTQYDDAMSVLTYSNRQAIRNELIAVRSEQLGGIKAEVLTGPAEIEWVGFDFVVIGGWSLLENGLFPAPSYFARWVGHLNANGLFDDPSILPAFLNDYQVVASKGGVEELPSPHYGVDALQIGRLR